MGMDLFEHVHIHNFKTGYALYTIKLEVGEPDVYINCIQIVPVRKIRNGSNVLKPNVFYVGYNTLTKEVLLTTFYRHKSDTYSVMESTFGEDWKESHPYLTVKLCEVVVHETENKSHETENKS